MENAMQRIELCENMAAMTQKLAEDILKINESLFSELAELRAGVQTCQEGKVKEEAAEKDELQDTSDSIEVTEDPEGEKGDEADINNSMELQLILANAGNVNEGQFASVDIRDKEVQDQDPSLTESQRRLLEIIDREVNAYKENLQEKTMSDIEDYNLQIDDDTRKVIGVEITLMNNQPRPEVDDVVLILGKEKGLITSVRGFKQPVVRISFQHPKTSLDLPKKFTVTHVPTLWTYNKMKVAVKDTSELKSDLHEILFGDTRYTPSISENPFPELANLNGSQRRAVAMTVDNPVTMIVGPPGTGKTTVISEMVKKCQGQILACAPSNQAASHLAGSLIKSGIKVLRIVSQSQQSKPENSDDYCLHTILAQDGGQLDEDEMNTKKHAIIANAHVIVTTCSFSACKDLAKLKFPTVIIDEAGQSSEPETLIPISKSRKKIVMIGDQKQLPPTAQTPAMQESLFGKLVKKHPELVTTLNVQYRMHPEISKFPNKEFYEGKIQDGVSEADRTIHWDHQEIRGRPVIFINTNGHEEKLNNSYFNRCEAFQTFLVVQDLVANGCPASSLGVICAYKAQKNLVEELLSMSPAIEKIHGEPLEYAGLKISTVDSFQGQERDIIILCTVRDNDSHDVGFLKESERLNVALTRAKRCMIIVGNSNTLANTRLRELAIEQHDMKLGVVKRIKTAPNIRRSDEKILTCTLNLNGEVNKRIGQLLGGREDISNRILHKLSDLLGCEVQFSKMTGKHDKTRDISVTTKFFTPIEAADLLLKFIGFILFSKSGM